MLTKNQLEFINKLLRDRTLNYSGFLIRDILKVNIDYKLKLLGYKTLISVGTPRDYLLVGVEFVSLNDNTSEIFIPKLLDRPHDDSYLYYFKIKLTEDIRLFLTTFAGADVSVLISEFKVSDSNNENLIGEQTMSKLAIRTVVKDIIKKVKRKKSGFYNLPGEDGDYSFTNLPFTFAVELTLKSSKKQDRFKVNGYYVPEDDVIEVLVLFNPEKLESQLYDLIGELNELMAHELEHIRQNYRGELSNSDVEQDNSLSYYLQDHEIPAQYKGFKRLSKLTKKPLKTIAKEWFDNNQDIHGLTDDEVKIVMDKILTYGNQK
jgi:hypothetical protein